MPKPADSPIFRFLTQKENLAAVLEVTRYTEEIREYVAGRFWNRLEEAIKRNPNGKFSFSWELKLSDKSDGCFSFVARPQGLSERDQGLRYVIETCTEYIGIGLKWRQEARQVAKFCQLESFKALLGELRKRLPGDIEPEPNAWWIWWEYWQRNLYVDSDPWSWFGGDFDDAFFNDKAEKFWEFVVPTHTLVLEANKSLSRSRP